MEEMIGRRKGQRVEGRKERKGGCSVRYMYTVNL